MSSTPNKATLESIQSLILNLTKNNADLSKRVERLESPKTNKRTITYDTSKGGPYKRMRLLTPSGSSQTIITSSFSSSSGSNTGSKQPATVNSEGKSAEDILTSDINDGSQSENEELESNNNEILEQANSDTEVSDHLLEEEHSPSNDEPQFASSDSPTPPNQEQGDNQEIGFPIIGSTSKSNWQPSDKVLNWYTKVADSELTEEQISLITSEYIPPESIAIHFNPPKIPNVLYKKLKSNPTESFKLKPLNKCQQSSMLAIRPLLTILESMDPEDPNMLHLTRAIQLLCHNNLQTSRMRRSLTASSIKADMRPFLFSQPVTHTFLFGDDFETVADSALKKQASSNKVLFTPKRQSTSQSISVVDSGTLKPSDFAKPGPSAASTSGQNPGAHRGGSFRGRNNRGRGQSRGKGRDSSKKE